MAGLALIGGHSVLGADFLAGFEPRLAGSDLGELELLERDGVFMLQRHGLGGYTAAAKIDHGRNLSALAELGCDRALAIASVGGLNRDLGVGTFLCPDDFIALHLGLSLSDEHGGERVPGFDREWRSRIIDAWSDVTDVPLVEGGTYWQAIGPRFETPAEIRLIASHAEVIGMTAASECVIAGELGIRYAAICVVDNLANGVAAEPLSVEEFEAGKVRNRERLLGALDAVIPALERER